MDMSEDRKLYTTEPYRAQVIYLLEDDTKPDNRIYLVVDDRGIELPVLGSEMRSLLAWWNREKRR